MAYAVARLSFGSRRALTDVSRTSSPTTTRIPPIQVRLRLHLTLSLRRNATPALLPRRPNAAASIGNALVTTASGGSAQQFLRLQETAEPFQAAPRDISFSMTVRRKFRALSGKALLATPVIEQRPTPGPTEVLGLSANLQQLRIASDRHQLIQPCGGCLEIAEEP